MLSTPKGGEWGREQKEKGIKCNLFMSINAYDRQVCVCFGIGMVQIELNLLFLLSITFGFGEIDIWNQLFIKSSASNNIILTSKQLFYSSF